MIFVIVDLDFFVSCDILVFMIQCSLIDWGSDIDENTA